MGEKTRKLIRKRVVLEFEVSPNFFSSEDILKFFADIAKQKGLKIFTKEIATIDDNGDVKVRYHEAKL